ncbi:MAG TPA: hypothetical protein VM783_09205 [Candidatus Acidoferrum sp.]|nr:hypothetical protein [Candidatus Acidoferrum sp.]
MAYQGYAANNIPINGSNWWDNSLTAAPTPAIATPDLNVGGLVASAPTMNVGADPSGWSAFSNWMGDSGLLGKRLADGTQVQGWGAPLLGAASGLANSYFGMQQLKLARDTLNANKEQFRLNFDASKNTTNAQLQDRQRARVASNPGAYQSVGDYMNQYGIKG